MAQSGHELVHRTCPLSGVKRTCRFCTACLLLPQKRTLSSIGRRRLRPNWFALNLSNILMLQRRDCSRGNFFAPFLHEMSSINEFERLRTAADVTTKRAHDRRSKDRISHADRHDTRSCPFVAPELSG